MYVPTLLAAGLMFPEAPRWHEGQLWLSDHHAHRVHVIDEAGTARVVAELDDMPSGLGFLADGSLLIAAMRSCRVYRQDAGGLHLYADLSAVGDGWINDMVVDGRGRAYVGFTGGGLYANEDGTSAIICVESDGSWWVATTEVSIPNGTVISPDNGTLVVAESGASRLTAFDVSEDGTLSGRRTFAAFDAEMPDGCCLDAEGAIWMAAPRTSRFIRVTDGGEVIDEVRVEDGSAIACTLGGPDGRTLYLVVTEFSRPNIAELRANTEWARDPELSSSRGRVDTVRVSVPAAGWP
ncbi:SMP-30/gluconolactonase/LRE family protein [Jatrophihabitans sp.]|uniref:SMP-30/gluconolactonase/LRE family protein n=1 Tax=Jatrophihabitans sp. TaxID=1932789 RepID=UPI0030C75671|nr:hypothetical protein [Jatrophihabitans sp.]